MGDFMTHLLVADLIPILAIMILRTSAGNVTSLVRYRRRPSTSWCSTTLCLPPCLCRSSRPTAQVIITGLFILSYFTCQWFFKRTKQEGAVCALIAGSPTIGFLGFAVLDPIFGAGVETGLVIAIVAIVVNAITIPIGFYLLNPASAPGADGAKAAPQTGGALMSALKQPVVWTPLLAVALVIIGVKIPDTIDPTFDLIGKVNSGMAVFAAGLTLSAYKIELDLEVAYNTAFKLILMPGVLLLAGWAWGMQSETLQMLVLSGALPPAFSGIIISSRFQVYTRTGTSTLATSMIGFIIAAPAWIYITRLVVPQ